MKIHTILLVLCLAFAGCTDGDDGGDAASTTSTTPSTTTSTSNTTAPEPTPERLEASLSISPATVQVGGNVTFDFDATAFLSDGSEDNVTIAYALVDLTGNTSYEGESGEGVPQAIVVAVNETGNHTFQLTVSAEGYDDAVVNGDVEVLEAEPEFETRSFSCTTTFGTSNPVIGVFLGDGLGGCTLLSGQPRILALEVNYPDGCEGSIDLDGDGLSDIDYIQGEEYDAGVQVTVFCDAGVLEVETSTVVALLE